MNKKCWVLLCSVLRTQEYDTYVHFSITLYRASESKASSAIYTSTCSVFQVLFLAECRNVHLLFQKWSIFCTKKTLFFVTFNKNLIISKMVRQWCVVLRAMCCCI